MTLAPIEKCGWHDMKKLKAEPGKIVEVPGAGHWLLGDDGKWRPCFMDGTLRWPFPSSEFRPDLRPEAKSDDE